MGRNIKVEDKAIKYIMKWEEDNEPEDCHNKGIGYDIKCRDKVIEVKGSTEKKIPFVTLNSSNLKAFDKYNNFYIYVVFDINEKPRLVILDKGYITRNKKEKMIVEIPIRAENYKKEISL